MTPELYKGLKRNRVNFDDDHKNWNKPVKIQMISTVMGVKFLKDPDNVLTVDNVKDPDKSYVLTVDNMIKILAIQMRFR